MITSFVYIFPVLLLMPFVIRRECSLIYIGFLCLYFLLIFGFRIDVGPDFDNYKRIYMALQEGTGPLYEHVITKTEPGYLLLNVIFIKLGLDYGSFVFFVFALTMFFYFSALRFFTRDYWLSMMLFLGLGLLMNALNLYRQAFALALLFFSLRYLIEGKKIKYTLLFLASFSLHYTSLVGLLYFFVRKIKQSYRLLIFLLLVTLALKVFLSGVDLIALIGSVFFIPKVYEPYFNNADVVTVGFGFRPYLDLMFVFMYIYLWSKQRFKENTVFLSYIFSLGVLANFVLVDFGIISRLPMYYYYIGYIAVPLTISELEDKRIKFYLTVFIGAVSLCLYVRAATSANYQPYCMDLLMFGKQCLN